MSFQKFNLSKFLDSVSKFWTNVIYCVSETYGITSKYHVQILDKFENCKIDKSLWLKDLVFLRGIGIDFI